MQEIVACFHPPILPGVVEMTEIKTMLLNATCSRYLRLICKPYRGADVHLLTVPDNYDCFVKKNSRSVLPSSCIAPDILRHLRIPKEEQFTINKKLFI
ncbi:hypothetical protein JTE90_018684 [Oedothorax gibbosus]|uniref:Uncharacterized protein n=1 Tax=Oedothorax gibbosus TaxID=931172 RepID=A0AAV6V242_9ARAC|nr:hypothetical protein JTE90_018684 [Oedothorax gibbosus]